MPDNDDEFSIFFKDEPSLNPSGDTAIGKDGPQEELSLNALANKVRKEVHNALMMANVHLTGDDTDRMLQSTVLSLKLAISAEIYNLPFERPLQTEEEGERKAAKLLSIFYNHNFRIDEVDPGFLQTLEEKAPRTHKALGLAALWLERASNPQEWQDAQQDARISVLQYVRGESQELAPVVAKLGIDTDLLARLRERSMEIREEIKKQTPEPGA